MHHSSQGMYKKDILAKSINLEVLKTTLGCLLIFFLLIIASRLVGYYEQAAAGSIDPNIIIPVIALRIPDFITLLIPLSFFLGILITISRLYGDNEIYAIFSGGRSLIDIIKFLLPQALFFIVLTAILSLNIAPYTKALSKEMLASKSISEKLQTLKPGELIEVSSGNFIKAKRSEEGALKNVIFISGDINDASLIISDQVLISESPDKSNIVFKDGLAYTDIINTDSQLITKFGEFKYDLDSNTKMKNNESLSKVYDFSDKSQQANFQWNLSIPLTIINLLFLGVFIGKVRPRQGRFAGILPGVFIYMMYISLLITARESIVSGGAFSSLGLWWVHGLFLLLTLFYISKYLLDFNLNILSSNSTLKKYFLIFLLFILSIWLVV